MDQTDNANYIGEDNSDTSMARGKAETRKRKITFEDSSCKKTRSISIEDEDSSKKESYSINEDYSVNENDVKQNESLLSGDIETHLEDETDFYKNLAKIIPRKVLEKYMDVTKCVAQNKKWAVLSGIVLTEKTNVEIISLGTGTKCICPQNLSQNGDRINDSHAEIIARRGLKRYLYRQLELFSHKDTGTIFMKTEKGNIKVKPGINFHLFVSSAPCGDSRVFSHNKMSGQDTHPLRKSRGLLRAKVHAAMGTLPVKNKLQTWDSLKNGQERLSTMSCSDKVLSWNVLGLQGALLSKFVDPIYLKTIIIGDIFNEIHLRRALFDRVQQHLEHLPLSYNLHKPLLFENKAPAMLQTHNSPIISYNWYLGAEKAEVINCSTGETEKNERSRISKSSLFECFLKTTRKLNLSETYTKSLYSDCKNSSKKYIIAQKEFYNSLLTANLGKWIKKPVEINQFKLTEVLSVNDKTSESH